MTAERVMGTRTTHSRVRRWLGLLGGAALLSMSLQGSASDVPAGDLWQEAKAAFAADRFEEARAHLQVLLEADSANADAAYLFARTIHALEGRGAALPRYQEVLQSAPGHAGARERIAEIRLAQGRLDAALALAEGLLEQDPRHVGALAIQGAVLGRRGQHVEAVAAAEEGYQVAPDDDRILALLAALYTDADRPDDARRVLEGGIAANPRNLELRALLVNQHLRAERLEPALELLAEMAELAPDEPAHWRRLAALQEEMGRIEEAEATLQQGMAAVPEATGLRLAQAEFVARHRGVAAAEALLRAALEERPEAPGLHLALARLLERRGRADQAMATYEHVVGAFDTRSEARDARIRLAVLLAEAGDHQRSRSLLDVVLVSDPSDVEALALRAGMALEHDRPGDAVADYQRALQAAPGSVELRARLAKAHLQAGDLEAAIGALEGVVEMAPGNVRRRLELVGLYGRAGRLGEARRAADRGLALTPDHLGLLRARFQAELDQADWSSALETARRIEGIVPESPLGPYLAAQALSGRADVAGVVEELERAVRRAPEPAALEALGRAYARSGALERGAQVLTALAERHPESAPTRLTLGQLHMMRRAYGPATEALRAAMELAPETPQPYALLASIHTAQGRPEAGRKVLREGLEATSGAPRLRAALERLDGGRAAEHPPEAQAAGPAAP